MPITGPRRVPAPPPPAIAHGADYAGVKWGGHVFTFSVTQRLIVAALFNARAQGYEWVTQESLIAVADSRAERLRDLFGRHPAFGTMIVSAVTAGGPGGAYRIVDPPASPPT